MNELLRRRGGGTRSWSRRGVMTALSLTGFVGTSASARLEILTRDPARLDQMGIAPWRGWVGVPQFNGVQPIKRFNAELDAVEPSWRPHCYAALAPTAWPYGDHAPLPPGVDCIHRFEIAGHGRASDGYTYGAAGFGDSAYFGMGGRAIVDLRAPDGWRSTGFDDRMIHVPQDAHLRERCEWSANHSRSNAKRGDFDEINFWLYVPQRLIRGIDAPWPNLENEVRGPDGPGPVTSFFQSVRSGRAGFMLRAHGGALIMRRHWRSAVRSQIVVPRGQLFDRWLAIRWRTYYHEQSGRMQIWIGGDLVYDEVGSTLPAGAAAAYAKFGLYTSFLGRRLVVATDASRVAPRRNAYFAGLQRHHQRA